MNLMGELAQRLTGVTARAAGNTVSPAVAAIMTAAGVALGKPELAAWAVPTSALVGSLTEEGVQLVRQVWVDKARRVEHFADVAAEESGADVADLLEAAAGDEKLRELLARTVDVVTSTIDGWKIEMLAKVFANGASDGARVNDLLLLTEYVRELEAPHARLLSTVYRLDHPNARTGDALVTDRDVVRIDPALRSSLLIVAIRLEKLGLVDVVPVAELKVMDFPLLSRPERAWRWTTLGRFCADRLVELGAEPKPAMVPETGS